MDEKPAAIARTLFKSVVNRDGRLRNEMYVIDISRDANDPLQFRRIFADGFQDWIAPEHVPIDGILIGEHSLRQSLADDRDALFVLHVGLIEIATRNDGNAQRGKKSRRDDTILRTRILFTGRVIMTIRAKLQRGTGAGIAPGSNHPKGRFVHARKRINATNDFLIK